MAIQIQVTKSPASKLNRLKALARVGVTLDFMGYRIEYKYAPVLETLLNMRTKKKGIVEISKTQFAEMTAARLKKTAPKKSKK